MGDEQNSEIRQMLSAYLDGELTHAEHQRVRVHLEDSADVREEFRQLRALKQVTSELAFSGPPEDRIEQLERRLSVQAPLRVGWSLLVIGVVAWSLYVGYLFVSSDADWLPKAMTGSVVIGLLMLLTSVARRRLLELPHDRYRGVKR